MAKGKRIGIVTLERGEHEDLMRGDAFTMAATLEIMRGLYDDKRWPMTYPGVVGVATVTETPLRAHVLSGLLVRPDANTYLTVDGGSLLAAVPPANSDDSILELVVDPGVSDGATLPFVANAAGSVRLDIVEVSIADTVLESSTRQVFNPGTRNFDPTSVNKVSAPRLSYRIRQGVAGSGLPAMASGWLPLAVICHQPSTTSFANCDMWDVRPLVADLVQFSTPVSDPVGGNSKFEQIGRDAHWISRAAGKLEGFSIAQYNGYIAGGQLLSNTAFPIGDFGNNVSIFDWSYSASRGPGFAMTANTLVHVAALFPGGLPRWVKYIDASVNGPGSKRVPYGPRGLLTLTNAQPNTDGSYGAQTLPATSGFVDPAGGVVLASLLVNNAGNALLGACVGNRTTFGGTNLTALPGIAGVGTNVIEWTFAPRQGVIVPAYARAVDLQFEVTMGSDVGQMMLQVKRVTGDVEVIYEQHLAYFGGGFAGKVTVRGIPLAMARPWIASGGGDDEKTYVRLSSGVAMSAALARVTGFSF